MSHTHQGVIHDVCDDCGECHTCNATIEADLAQWKERAEAAESRAERLVEVLRSVRPYIDAAPFEGALTMTLRIDAALAEVGKFPCAPEKLVRNVVRHLAAKHARSHGKSGYFWGRLTEVFCVGSTYACQIARACGVDPDTGKQSPEPRP